MAPLDEGERDEDERDEDEHDEDEPVTQRGGPAFAALWSRLPVTEDVAWWCGHARDAPGGRVLYIGAGTGRLALSIAQHCRSLVAVERDPDVAAVLRARVAGAVPKRGAEDSAARPGAVPDGVVVVEADALDLDADGPSFAGWFGRVLVPSGLLNELLEPNDRVALLRLAAQRCAADGRVLLQVLNPYWLVHGPPVEDGMLVPDGGARPLGVRVHRLEAWPWTQRQRLKLVYTFAEAEPGVPADRATDSLDVVALFPAELRQLCRRAGLEVVERWGPRPGVDPLDRTGGSWHLVCRRVEPFG